MSVRHKNAKKQIVSLKKKLHRPMEKTTIRTNIETSSYRKTDIDHAQSDGRDLILRAVVALLSCSTLPFSGRKVALDVKYI